MKLARLHEDRWAEYGILDPRIEFKQSYSDQDISDACPKVYGFADFDHKDQWEALRNHGAYINTVRNFILDDEIRIANLKSGTTMPPAQMDDALASLTDLMDTSKQIADDIRWKDIRDIAIAIQHNQILIELSHIIDALKKTKKREVI